MQTGKQSHLHRALATKVQNRAWAPSRLQNFPSRAPLCTTRTGRKIQ